MYSLLSYINQFNSMKLFLLALFLVTALSLQGVTELTDANFKEEVYS